MNTEVIDAPEQGVKTEIVEYTQTAAELAKLRQRYANVAWDCSTTKGDKDARAVRMELVKLRTSLDKMRLGLNEADQERIRRRNAEAKRITAEIATLEEPVDAAIKAEEARREAEKQRLAQEEAQRVARIQDYIEGIREHATDAANLARSSAEVGELLALCESKAIAPATYAEFTEQAQAAKDAALASIRATLTRRIEQEHEAARIVAEREELARLRAEHVERDRIERERVAAEQAAERARIAAERAALEAEQQIARAEQARLDAAAAAERRRADAEAAAARAEADRVAREAREAEERKLAAERAEMRRAQVEAAAVAQREEEARLQADRLIRDAAPRMLRALVMVRNSQAFSTMDTEVAGAVDEAIHLAQTGIDLADVPF